MLASTSGKGTLFLVSGPGGAGKKAVIEGARRRLGGDPGFVFPLRTINRPTGAGGEIHVAVTPAQFDRLRRRGAFSFCWGTRGVNYAIPMSIDCDLASGRVVVVNVGACVLGDARARYPGASIVWIAAAPEICRRRLLVRGAESPAEIDKRLALCEEMPIDGDVEILVNEGPLAEAVDAFVGLLRGHAGLPAPTPTKLPGVDAASRL